MPEPAEQMRTASFGDAHTERVLAAVREAILACITCGKIHTYRMATKFPEDTTWTWGSPDDGHAYRKQFPDMRAIDLDRILDRARLVLEAKMSTTAQSACDIEYPRPGGRQRGDDRIVRCDLPRGHHGDHCETDTGSMWHARPPAQTAQDGLAETGEGAGTTEGSEARTGGSLTDIIGLDPNLTGGLDADEYIRRQYCDHGPELDELRRQVQAVRALHQLRVTEQSDGTRHEGITCEYDDEIWPCPTIQALGGGEA